LARHPHRILKIVLDTSSISDILSHMKKKIWIEVAAVLIAISENPETFILIAEKSIGPEKLDKLIKHAKKTR